jgi:hypothetical protein
MNNSNTLERLRQCFTGVIPKIDSRSEVSPLEFVINLIFCYFGDTECVSLEAIRRHMKKQTHKNTGRGSFWEKLSRQRLTGFLISAITELLRQLGTSIIGGGCLLEQLGVVRILVVDSTYLSLWDGAADDFPVT